MAVGASEYEFTVNGQDLSETAADLLAAQKTLPEHPLTVSDPLSAGQVGPTIGKPLHILLMPLIIRH